MKLLVGLGNPGDKYLKTRHNAGWIALEQLCISEGFTDFLYNKKFHAEIANGLLGKRQVIAIKPQTFMNKSGKSVGDIVQYYKIDLQDIVVLQDDIDLPFGALKLKYGGSHGGHNGIKDIIAVLGTDKFWRLKIGIGRPTHAGQDVVDYVLEAFSGTELHRFKEHEKSIRERIGDYLKNTG